MSTNSSILKEFSELLGPNMPRIESSLFELSSKVPMTEMLSFCEKCSQVLVRRGAIPGYEVLQPSLLCQLIEQGVQQQPERRREIWAALVCGMLDFETGPSFRWAYLEIARGMEHQDLEVLLTCCRELRLPLTDGLNTEPFQRSALQAITKERIRAILYFSDWELILSLENLRRLGCIAPHFKTLKTHMAENGALATHDLVEYSGYNWIEVTNLGIAFAQMTSA